MTQDFRQEIVTRGDRRVPAYTVRCSRAGCNSIEHVFFSKSSMPDVLVQRKLTERGWETGKNRTHDVCPDCRKKDRAAARHTRITNHSNGKGTHMSGAEAKTVKAFSEISASPPPEMRREDRRIIFAKLEEVYVSETEGYDAAWNDIRVAEDLGVPKAWVVAIREENFGPTPDSAAARKLLDDAQKAVEDARKIVAAVAAGQKQMAALTESVKQIDAKLEKLSRDVAQARAGR